MKLLIHKNYIIYKFQENLFAAFIGLIAGLAAAALDFLILFVHEVSFGLNLAYLQIFLLAVYSSFINSVEKGFAVPGLLLALRFLRENLIVPLFIWITKFVGVILSLSILPVGREGPAMLLGTGLGQYIAQLFKVPKGQMSYWGTIGAAAFVGAFLKTPLGATFYVFENRFGKILNVSFIINALSAATVSYTVYVFLRGGHPIIPVSGHFDWDIYDLVPAFFLGVLTSILTVFTLFLYELFKYLARLVDEPFRPLSVFPVVLLLFTVAHHHESVHLLELSVNYKPIEELSSQIYPIGTVVGLILLEVLFLTVLLSFGFPGGIILPLIFLGVALGNIVAHTDPEKLPIFALTGAAAMICAAMNVPITAVVMISEMSHQTLIVPEIVGVLTAYFLASSVKLLKK